MLIAVVNESTVVSNVDVARMAAACGKQVRHDLAPAWERMPSAVIHYPDLKSVPPGADVLAVLDDADQQGALGYHDETPDGRPYGKVFAKTVLDYQGGVLTGDLSVATTLSHEVCELFVDPNVNNWVDNGGNQEICSEVCDPVEDKSYMVQVWSGKEWVQVSVSDFVTPAYFDVQSPAGSRLDQMNVLTRPWSYTSGGYLIVRKAGTPGQVHSYSVQVGDAYPDWKRDVKLAVAARTLRRLQTV